MSWWPDLEIFEQRDGLILSAVKLSSTSVLEMKFWQTDITFVWLLTSAVERKALSFCSGLLPMDLRAPTSFA